MTEPMSKFSGEPLSYWMECLPNDLEVDAVGLWEIIPALRDDFGLEGEEIEKKTREIIASLLARGARPIIGADPDNRVTAYGDDPAGIIDGVIADWRKMNRDPHVGDIWFALPTWNQRVQ